MSVRLRLRLLIFALVAVASVVLAGVKYVGIPERYLGDSYLLSVNLPRSGGIFPNAEVTLRGVQVGRVTSLHLTPDGVRADLRIKRGVKVPRDTRVQVADLSAVGEQYVDLQPAVDHGPYLRAGAALPVSAATTPPAVTSLLVSLDRLATSVGKKQLREVVHQLGDAFDGSSQDLATVLTRAQQLSADLGRVQPQTDQLLSSSKRVLGTQRDLDPALQQLSTQLDTLTATLAQEDPALRDIIDQTPATLDDVRTLLTQSQPAIGVLLGNLLTVTQIVANPIRLRGINDELVMLPGIVQGTFNIQPGDGYARLGAVIDSSQRVCSKGYESSGQPPLEGTQVSKVPGNPSLRANLNAYCAMPASSGVDVRGAANVPRPPGDDTATVIPEPNPRGFGPGSSFATGGAGAGADSAGTPGPSAGSDGDTGSGDGGASGDTADDGSATLAPGSVVKVVGPTDLRGLLMKGLG